MSNFQEKVKALRAHHEELLSRKNEPMEWGNGIYEKYRYAVKVLIKARCPWQSLEHGSRRSCQRIWYYLFGSTNVAE